MRLRTWMVIATLVLLLPGPSTAADPAVTRSRRADEGEEKKSLSQEELNQKLQADLTNVKLIGSFTISGKEGQPPKSEEYTIHSAIKVPDEEHVWLLRARIKYGDKDTTVPIPLEIRWAGDTPVITLTNLEIPGLGTFTSRVVLYEGRYAGTWQHGDVGGHLFGRMEKSDGPKSDNTPSSNAKSDNGR